MLAGFAWLCLALAVSLASVSAYSYNKIEGLKEQVKGLTVSASARKSKIDQLIASNESGKESLKSCEAVIVASKTAQEAAIIEASKEVEAISAKYERKDFEYQTLLRTPQCETWADKPSCVSP